MSDLRVSDIAKITGFSLRYWQKRIVAGDVPAVRYLDHGGRRTYLINADKFDKWWKRQLCPATFEKGAVSGGSKSAMVEKITKGRFKQTTSQSLKAELRQYAKT